MSNDLVSVVLRVMAGGRLEAAEVLVLAEVLRERCAAMLAAAAGQMVNVSISFHTVDGDNADLFKAARERSYTPYAEGHTAWASFPRPAPNGDVTVFMNLPDEEAEPTAEVNEDAVPF